MARRTTPIPPEGPVLLVIPRAEAIRRIDDRIAKGGEIKTRQFQDAASLAVARNDYYTWTEYNEEMLRQMFTSTKLPDEYSSSIGFVAGSKAISMRRSASFKTTSTRRFGAFSQSEEGLS
jgi:hypothetical protein